MVEKKNNSNKIPSKDSPVKKPNSSVDYKKVSPPPKK